MNIDLAIVLTSINPPNSVMAEIAKNARERALPFIVIGDTKSPAGFQLDGCRFYGVDAQRESGLAFAAACPMRHYSRKNVGYLLAMRDGAAVIAETDDDNHPSAEFFDERSRRVLAARLRSPGWVNVYRYFTTSLIWPRGLPLDAIHAAVHPYAALEVAEVDCPIQQGLADDNPDVDAIYRLVLPLPQRFARDRQVALTGGTWCPFNSQNTRWWRDAFPLMYLPSHCSFRMTDIWRSFVAQRILRENDWAVLFHAPTVSQERNEHDLMRDFADEVPGYLHNDRIAQALDALELAAGRANIPDNLLRCYDALVALGVVAPQEMDLLRTWLRDLADLRLI
jgi:hypothetical protein